MNNLVTVAIVIGFAMQLKAQTKTVNMQIKANSNLRTDSLDLQNDGRKTKIDSGMTRDLEVPNNVVLKSTRFDLKKSEPLKMSTGGHDGNGGDLACDSKIQTIANDIRLWIENDGAQVGKLNLSTSSHPVHARPYTLAEYQESMLDLLRLPLDSSCVTQGDPGYPVKVGNNSKICVTWKEPRGLRMKCDQAKFLALDPDSQIEQIHHEFASYVPGLEPVEGPISSYKISLQLSRYTQDVIERRLVVTPGTNEQDSPQSHYKILKDAFDKSGSAKIEDFPSIADFGFLDKLNLVCAFVWGPQGKLIEGYENRFGRVDFKIPAQGPLFPEKTVSAIAPAIRYDADYSSTNERFAHFFKDDQGRILIKTFANQNGDLQTDYASVGEGQKQSLSHFIYRKQGKTLYVRGVGTVSYKDPYSGRFSEGAPMDMYGYCYPPKY